MRGADKAARIGQVLKQPREKGKILAAQVGVDAERLELLWSGDETGFLAELSCGGVGETLPGLGHAFGNVPARRAGRVTEQEVLSIGDDHTAAGLPPGHGQATPPEMLP